MEKLPDISAYGLSFTGIATDVKLYYNELKKINSQKLIDFGTNLGALGISITASNTILALYNGRMLSQAEVIDLVTSSISFAALCGVVTLTSPGSICFGLVGLGSCIFLQSSIIDIETANGEHIYIYIKGQQTFTDYILA